MPGCCSQVGLRAMFKAGLVAETMWGRLLLPANARLLLSGWAEGSSKGLSGDSNKVGLVVAASKCQAADLRWGLGQWSRWGEWQ
uniref:Uncharacterized protein n=1 Tax=Timema shepardi TaxID=629360 RepID=A0A7R9G4Y1_TIMSH|nr:unnamed protein product [Timema shepardi]